MSFTLRMALRFTAWLQERSEKRLKHRMESLTDMFRKFYRREAERQVPRGNLIIFTSGRKVEIWGVDPDPEAMSLDDVGGIDSSPSPNWKNHTNGADEPIPYELTPKPKQPWEPEAWQRGPIHFVRNHGHGVREVISACLSEDWMASQGWQATDQPFPNRDRVGADWLDRNFGDVPYRHTFLGHPIEWNSDPDEPVTLLSLKTKHGEFHVKPSVEHDPKYPGFSPGWWEKIVVKDKPPIMTRQNIWEQYEGSDCFGPYWAVNGTFSRDYLSARSNMERALSGLLPKPAGVA